MASARRNIAAQVAAAEGVRASMAPRRRRGAGLARRMGVEWAGGSDAPPPAMLDAAIVFAPVGGLVPTALAAVRKGGTVVCGGIHMSDIPTFPYRLLWGERVLRSVANLTRDDAIQFLALAPRVPVRTEVIEFPLRSATKPVALRQGKLGALRSPKPGGRAISETASCFPRHRGLRREYRRRRPGYCNRTETGAWEAGDVCWRHPARSVERQRHPVLAIGLQACRRVASPASRTTT